MALIDAGLVTLLAMHDAFRRDLDRLVAAAEAGAAPAVLRAYWDAFEVELHDHHRVEDDDVYPQVRAVLGAEAASVFDEMDAEHDALIAAIDTAGASLAADDLRHLRAIAIAHLAHEEADAVPLIRVAADDEFMTGFFARRQAEAVPPRYLPWVLDGACDAVVAQITAPLPAPVLTLLDTEWRPARQALVDALATSSAT